MARLAWSSVSVRGLAANPEVLGSIEVKSPSGRLTKTADVSSAPEVERSGVTK